MQHDLRPLPQQLLDILFSSGLFKRYRHLKRGTTYVEVGRGEVQSDTVVREGDELVVYVGENGRVWLRPPSEFNDGRFQAFSASIGR